MGGNEKVCEWRIGEIVNKIENSNPKISLINYIDTPPNPTSNNMLEIADSDANIHLSKQATPTMAPVMMEMIWDQDYQMEELWSPHIQQHSSYQI